MSSQKPTDPTDQPPNAPDQPPKPTLTASALGQSRGRPETLGQPSKGGVTASMLNSQNMNHMIGCLSIAAHREARQGQKDTSAQRMALFQRMGGGHAPRALSAEPQKRERPETDQSRRSASVEPKKGSVQQKKTDDPIPDSPPASEGVRNRLGPMGSRDEMVSSYPDDDEKKLLSSYPDSPTSYPGSGSMSSKTHNASAAMEKPKSR